MSGLLDQAGLTAGSGLTNGAGLYRWGNFNPFDPTDLDPYLLFDTGAGSMIGTLENPTLDLDPSNQETLDVITATRSSVATRTLPDGTIALAAPDTVRVDYTQGDELTPTVYQRVGYTDFSQGWLHSGVSTVIDAEAFQGQIAKRFSVDGFGAYYTVTPTQSGQEYTTSFYARLVSGSPSYLYFFNNFTDVVYTPISVTSEWQRFTVTVTATGANVNFGIVNTAGTEPVVVEISQPQFEEGTTATDFVANTTGSPKFLSSAVYSDRVPMVLIEPSAENFVDYSEDFSQWTSENATVSLNVIESPAGTQDGCKMIASTSVERQGIHSVQGQSGDLSFSVYAKKGEYDVIQMTDAINGSLYVNFNLTSGTVGSYNGVTPKIENVGNGWFRCSLTWNTVPINKMRLTIARTDDESRLETFAGNGTDGLYLWGAQLETGSVSTSYIPTSGGNAAARTRAADNLEITGSDFDFYNQSEGTVYAEFLYDHDQTSKYVYSITETGANEIRSQLLASALRTRYTVNSSHLANLENSGILKGSLNRIAFSYKTNNFRANLNGGSDEEELSGTASINPIKLSVGSRSTANHLNGHIKRLLFWPTHSSRL